GSRSYWRAGQAPKVTKHFLCLFHAILAAGVQLSDRPVEQRSNLFHKHLRHALNYLGTFEVVLNPTIELIQGLIVISQILQNDVNPRGAWILSGITIRSAICLGVHKKGPRPESSQLSSGDAAKLRWELYPFCLLLHLSVGNTD
ncbi:unnamed protein product, partial [Clonostachys rhizophaga]